jgi:hypothetical protein
LKVSNATALANTIKSVQEPTAATIHRRGCHFGSCIQAGSWQSLFELSVL